MTFSIELDGRRALVSGAGQGVGRAIAMRLASAGAEVLVNDVVPGRADAVVDEIRAAAGKAEPAPFDVTNWDSVRTALEERGPVQILVNNAGNAGADGFAGMVPFAESDPADWDRYVQVNLYGVMHCTRAALPGMIAGGEGRVVTIISDSARRGDANLAPYAAAKAGAAGFCRSVAREVGRYGITVNCVALATVDTSGPGQNGFERSMPADEKEKRLRQYVIRRFGEPDEVAGMVTFLASPMAAWITGQTYPVNGGYSFAL
jgi:NAD(P)-dependent dehydrogenase (short-subunit alcohol dehydrogenase family)